MKALKYAKMLEKVGFTRQQAEQTIEVLQYIMESNLVTKQELTELRF